MFSAAVALIAVSISSFGGSMPASGGSAKPLQSIVDMGGGGGGADNSGMIELCASRAMAGNTCFYQNLHFR